jgi:hypothetical protein
MDWVPIRTTQTTSFLSTAHNCISGGDQIQNYWLKTLPAASRHITKNFNAIMEEPEKIPEWMTTGITYLLPKSGDSKEVRNYRQIMCLTTMFKTLAGLIARRISTLDQLNLLPAD